MVDMTALTALHGSPATVARVRARRRAEWRLKAYGMMAIGLAALALVALLGSVFSKAGGALTESYVTLPVDLSSSKINADDPSDGNYTGLMKDTLKEAFPGVKGRGDKRALYGIVSGGSTFELQEFVVANPALLGQTAEFRFLLSDDADLYLKGFFGELQKSEGKGHLTITGEHDKTGGEVELTSSRDDFADELAAVKVLLTDDAKRLRREAARQDNARAVFAQRAAKAQTDEDRADLLKNLTGTARSVTD